jgi:hypothetical protein
LDLLKEFEKKKKNLPHKVQLVSRTNNRAPCSWRGLQWQERIRESKWANAKPGELTKKGK